MEKKKTVLMPSLIERERKKICDFLRFVARVLGCENVCMGARCRRSKYSDQNYAGGHRFYAFEEF